MRDTHTRYSHRVCVQCVATARLEKEDKLRLRWIDATRCDAATFPFAHLIKTSNQATRSGSKNNSRPFSGILGTRCPWNCGDKLSLSRSERLFPDVALARSFACLPPRFSSTAWKGSASLSRASFKSFFVFLSFRTASVLPAVTIDVAVGLHRLTWSSIFKRLDVYRARRRYKDCPGLRGCFHGKFEKIPAPRSHRYFMRSKLPSCPLRPRIK